MKNICVDLRFAHSLMALSVSLKFSLFGTRYKISSVTRQPVRKKKKKKINIKSTVKGSMPSQLWCKVLVKVDSAGKKTEAMKRTIKAADTPNVQVSEDGVSP